jgi:hypothetical protein
MELFGRTCKLKLMRVWLLLLQKGIPKGSNYGLEEIRIKSKLEGKYDFKKLRSCVDLIEDTEEAIIEFYIYRLSTDSKRARLGERYLRLYGILNTVYLQMQAIIELSELVKYPNKKNIQQSFKNLKITELRHIVGAHTINYVPSSSTKFQVKEGTKNSFRITQMDLKADGSNVTLVDVFGGYEEVDLFDEVLKYLTNSQVILIQITEKYINTLFKENKHTKEEFISLLEPLKLESEKFSCEIW